MRTISSTVALGGWRNFRRAVLARIPWSCAGLTAMALLALPQPVRSENWTVVSPNGQVRLSVQLADRTGKAGFPKGTSLSYCVEQGPEGSRVVVVKDSPLGLRLSKQDFVTGLRFETAQPQRLIEESYAMPHGKRRECTNRAKHLTLSFRNAAGGPLELDLRAYDDGVAFRYRLPGSSPAPQTLESEATGFALPADAKAWMAPNDKPSTYAPAYETYYENGIAVGATAPLGMGWEFPVLLRTAEGRWGLITESNVGPNFCATRLASDAPNGLYRVAFPDPAEGHGQGSVKPSSTLPWEMPWRVIVVGPDGCNLPDALVYATFWAVDSDKGP
jgi:alpha-glucosidase